MKNIELSENELNLLIDSLSKDYYTGNPNYYKDINAGFKDRLIGKLMKERNK